MYMIQDEQPLLGTVSGQRLVLEHRGANVDFMPFPGIGERPISILYLAAGR